MKLQKTFLNSKPTLPYHYGIFFLMQTNPKIGKVIVTLRKILAEQAFAVGFEIFVSIDHFLGDSRAIF
jgi:hypothetical protein